MQLSTLIVKHNRDAHFIDDCRQRKHRFSTAFHMRLAVAWLAASAVWLLTSCSPAVVSSGADTTHSRRAEPTKPFRVALLTPGPISDQSWNGGAYQGLLRIRDSLGATVSHIQTKTPAEFEEQFRQYGSQGYDLVFGHGFEFQDAAKRVGPDFPQTIYVMTSGSTVGANVAGIEFAFADASYLAGLLAGAMTKTERHRRHRRNGAATGEGKLRCRSRGARRR